MPSFNQYVSHSELHSNLWGWRGLHIFPIGPSPAAEVRFRRALRLYRRCRVTEENSSRWLEQDACRSRAERSDWTTFTILPSCSPARNFGHSHRRRSTVSVHWVFPSTSVVCRYSLIVIHWPCFMNWLVNFQLISKWMVLLIARANICRDRDEEDRWTSWDSARTFTSWIGWKRSQIHVECGFWPVHYNP